MNKGGLRTELKRIDAIALSYPGLMEVSDYIDYPLEHFLHDIQFCIDRKTPLSLWEPASSAWVGPKGNAIYILQCKHLAFCEDVLGIKEEVFEKTWAKFSMGRIIDEEFLDYRTRLQAKKLHQLQESYINRVDSDIW